MAVANKPTQFSKRVSDQRSQAIRLASEMYKQEPDWVTFFREILGIDGMLRRIFASPDELAAFEKTNQYAEIQRMLANLRERSDTEREPTRVITLRLPKSLHESLRSEAHDRRTSLNQLCISKLLNMIDGEMAVVDSDSMTLESASVRPPSVRTEPPQVRRKPR